MDRWSSAPDLGACRGIAGDRVIARQRTHPLSKGCARRKGVSVVPTAQVAAGRALSGAHTEGPQQRILIQIQDQAVILARLVVERPGAKLHLTKLKFREGRGNRNALARGGRCTAPSACREQAES